MSNIIDCWFLRKLHFCYCSLYIGYVSLGPRVQTQIITMLFQTIYTFVIAFLMLFLKKLIFLIFPIQHILYVKFMTYTKCI